MRKARETSCLIDILLEQKSYTAAVGMPEGSFAIHVTYV